MDNIAKSLLCRALKLYDLKQPESEFIRHNENIIYKITDINKKYVLRIYKSAGGFSPTAYSDYNHNKLIQSEVEIIAALKNNTKIPMQTPVCGLDGSFVQSVDNIPITLLEWVDGEDVHTAGRTPEILYNGGKMIAEMHSFFSSKGELIKNYKRYNYDGTVIPKISERIENSASFNIIKLEQAKIILAALNEMRKRFNELDNMQEKHIIHADLGGANMIVDKNGRLSPIDFSLCGYGHFYMDINMFNGDLKFSRDIIEGYKSIRNCEIIPRYMEPYVALGFVLYISYQDERAKAWDWFPNTIENMCRDCFKPLADTKAFITIK